MANARSRQRWRARESAMSICRNWGAGAGRGRTRATSHGETNHSAAILTTWKFSTGLNRLMGMAARQRTAILCAEGVWWRCHRALISDAFKAAGFVVLH